jgi:hypothetical protein
VDNWCTDQGIERGAVVPLDQAWELARRWYGDRLRPDWRRPSAAETQRLFAEVGLTRRFWRLEEPG